MFIYRYLTAYCLYTIVYFLNMLLSFVLPSHAYFKTHHLLNTFSISNVEGKTSKYIVFPP